MPYSDKCRAIKGLVVHNKQQKNIYVTNKRSDGDCDNKAKKCPHTHVIPTSTSHNHQLTRHIYPGIFLGPPRADMSPCTLGVRGCGGGGTRTPPCSRSRTQPEGGGDIILYSFLQVYQLLSVIFYRPSSNSLTCSH